MAVAFLGIVLGGGMLVGGVVRLGRIWRFVKSFESPRLKECLPFLPTWFCLLRKNKFSIVLKALKDHILELEHAEQQLGEWVSEIAHDLNAPLGAIKGYAEILISQSSQMNGQETERYTHAILSLGDQLEDLVQDLLQISLIKSGRHAPQLELLSLAELVSHVTELYRDRFLKSGLVLVLHPPEDLCLIQGNARLLQRMVQNLLENARQYSKAGTKVELSFSLLEDGFEFSIVNQSETLGAADLSPLFQRYERGMVASRQGAGLGLTIVKEIVEVHQAHIAGFRAENGQTTFVIRFNK